MTRMPSSLEFLQAIHQAGGEVAYDVAAIVARLGLPKKHVRKYIAGCVDHELLMRIDRGTGPILALTPTGLDTAMVREPVQPVAAKPSPPPSSPAPPPSSSSAPPQPTRANVQPRYRLPLSHDEMLLRKQDNQIHILRTIRHFNGVPDNTEHIDRDRLYLDRELLGADLRATVEEYLQFKAKTKSFPSSFIPAGLDERQAKAIRDKVTRPARTAAESKRKAANKAADQADRVQTVGGLNPRASAIYLALAKPKTISELATVLRRHPAFLTSSGDRLDERSLKRTIQRLLDGALADRVDVTRTRHKNGWEMDVFRRR